MIAWPCRGELSPRYFLGARAMTACCHQRYDARDRGPVPEKDKETGKRLYKGDFDEDGRPLCACGKAMGC